jgi:hypothetical protein
MGNFYNFFLNTLGRDSIDGAGMPLLSTVRYCDPSSPCPYQNAFWNGSQMVFGQGYASADDVVGHEMTHGVTARTSALFYFYQSGAINESLSDVFGELIDQTYPPGAGADPNWLIGEDLPGGAIRSMSNPPAFNQPDTMTSPNYTGTTSDNGGVHTNSGVNNKAAYLMTNGGTFNGMTVAGIGITKAAHIYYEVDANLLTSAGDYADLYDDLQQACTNLIGTAGITATDCTSVTEAVQAVQMNVTPPAAPAPEAPVCTNGASPTDLFSDNLENTASGNWTTQTGSGTNTWFYPENPNSVGFDALYATSGTTNFWGYDQLNRADYSIALTRSIGIPAGVPAYLRFNHAYAFEASPFTAFDGGVLEYSTNGGATWTDAGPLFTDNGYDGTLYGGNPLGARRAFVNVSNGYISSRADLASLAGQSIRFRFRIGTDSIGDDYGWFVDDIRIYSCGVPQPTATTGGASGIGLATATIAGAVNPNTQATAYRFDYGTTSAYGSSTVAGNLGAGNTNASVSAPLGGLAAGTTYHYRVVALRGGAVAATGADQAFTTGRLPLNRSAPTLTGKPTPGAALTCAVGSWTDASSFTYGWLHDGAPIGGAAATKFTVRTSDLGHKLSCRVTARNSLGTTSATSAALKIVDLNPPKLTNLKLSPTKFKPATSGGSTAKSGNKGTQVNYKLDEQSTVTFTVEQAKNGRMVKGECKAQNNSNKKNKSCTYYTTLKGSFTWSTKSGNVKFRFTGRFNGHTLKAGNYRLVATAKDTHGNKATPVKIKFTIK